MNQIFRLPDYHITKTCHTFRPVLTKEYEDFEFRF